MGGKNQTGNSGEPGMPGGYAEGDPMTNAQRQQASRARYAQPQQQPEQAPQAPAFHMPSFHMPSFHMPHTPQAPEGPSYEEQLAEQQRMQGIQERDSLYSEYMNAATTATDYVNSMIERERANAELLGIEYEMTDELKQERLSNKFADLWGAGSQSRLEALFDQYGRPQGFTDWIIQRGKGSGGVDKQGDPVGTPSTGAPKTLLTDEETIPSLGAPATLLGGGA